MRSNSRPSIDVILCCYNQEQFIAEAVQSILVQKVDADVRVIVADDCSTDGTLSIIKQYEASSPFPFVYLEGDSNMGLHANYRRAFAACEAEYTAILEGDDWWNEDWHLSQHINFLQSHKCYSMSFSQIVQYYETDHKYSMAKWPFGKIGHVKVKLRHQIALGNLIGNLSACVFRTKLLHSLPEDFYKLRFADWDLGIMMALSGPLGYLKGNSSIYRISDSGQWSGLTEEKKVESQRNTLEAIRLLLPNYCGKYIDEFWKGVDTGVSIPIPMPFKYRIKALIAKICKQ